ncbi:MAG: PBSX family phage terminase large subunit [Rhodospirillaceae bacterium]
MPKRQTSDAFRFRKWSRRQKQLLTWWRPGSPYADYDAVIAEGSIRSGKTVAEILSFLLWAQESYDGESFILAAKSMGALKRNVIRPLLRILAALGLPYDYVRAGADPHIRIGTNTFYLFGANNEAAQDVLQGMTAAGAYLDDAGKIPWSFIEQAFGRCSVDGAKVWLNCNPEGPFHPIKLQLIDQAREKRVLVLHFVMEDNLTLSPRVRERYRRQHAGVFYKRNILGLWVAAEGQIFDMLTDTSHVVTAIPSIVRSAVGLDYGASGVTTAWLLGVGVDQTLYFIDFWRWNKDAEGHGLTDVQVCEALERWLGSLGITPEMIVVPDDAGSLLTTLYQRGNDQSRAGKPSAWGRVMIADRSPGSVARGIQHLASLLQLRRLLFGPLVQAKSGLTEWVSYVWDAKAQAKGEDAPLKQNDHDPDAGRYVVDAYQSIWMPWLTGARAA